MAYRRKNQATSSRSSSSSSTTWKCHKNPPQHHPGSKWVWQPTVASWEKKFCSTLCSLPWKKIEEAIEYNQWYYKDILKWDDSAGEEAFKNAKARFWFEMNGFSFNNIPLPDPDIYIDEIDWNAEVDSELIADLDKRQYNSEDEDANDNDNDIEGDKVSRNEMNPWFKEGVLFYMDKPLPCTGWGNDVEDEEEEEEEKKEDAIWTTTTTSKNDGYPPEDNAWRKFWVKDQGTGSSTSRSRFHHCRHGGGGWRGGRCRGRAR